MLPRYDFDLHTCPNKTLPPYDFLNPGTCKTCLDCIYRRYLLNEWTGKVKKN